MQGMRVTEILATDYFGNFTKRSIIGDYLNLLYAAGNGKVECTSRSQAFVNSLICENGTCE
jgi:hypothetical protein